MNFQECMEFIGSYSRLGGKITDLSRAQELMERIGNPEKKLKFVHIAGTNGKGSTLEYISRALELSGYKTGKLTSPYVTHYTDRIRINDKEIDEGSLGEICGFVAEKVADRKYSQFEITMAVALLWFVREECDIVVLETGIGGLLDSTNVIETNEAAVITSISLDHTAVLGNTIGEIALQKCGIIKKNTHAILSPDNPEKVRDIFLEAARNACSEAVITLQEDIIVKSVSAQGNVFEYKGREYATGMGGLHQVCNAVSAIETCGILRSKGYQIPDEKLIDALRTAGVEARIQLIPGDPDVIVDGGHNAAGAAALADVLRQYPREKVYAVLGMVQGKDYVTSARTIAEAAGCVICVDDFTEGAVTAKELQAAVSELTVAECSTLSEAAEKVRRLASERNGIAVICGSLYLAGEYLNRFAQ